MPIKIILLLFSITFTQRLINFSNNLIKSFSMKLFKLKEKIIYSFSHFDLNIEVYFAKVIKIKFKNYQWLSLTKIDNSGLPTVMRKIVNKYINSI